MHLKKEIALSFDDIVIETEYSGIKRGEADVTPKPFKNISPKIPIISSPMSSVTEEDMIEEMIKLGGLGIHHRYCSTEKLLEISDTRAWDSWKCIATPGCYGWNFPIAFGSIPSHKDTIDKFVNPDINRGSVDGQHKFFCVDVANGAHINAINTIRYIRGKVPDADIMSGNVATASMARMCITAGANVIRVGIGGGSVCTTREVTGCGIPTLQSIIEIREMLKYPETEKERELFPNVILVSDGGIRNSGDIVKALAAGANYVIIGKLFAGTDESPGEIKEVIDLDPPRTLFPRYKEATKKVKIYYGMASEKALVEQNGKDPNHLHVEGEETTVSYVGPVKNVVDRLVNGLKQAMFYTNSKNLEELQNVVFRIISNNGLKEGTAHGKAK